MNIAKRLLTEEGLLLQLVEKVVSKGEGIQEDYNGHGFGCAYKGIRIRLYEDEGLETYGEMVVEDWSSPILNTKGDQPNTSAAYNLLCNLVDEYKQKQLEKEEERSRQAVDDILEEDTTVIGQMIKEERLTFAKKVTTGFLGGGVLLGGVLSVLPGVSTTVTVTLLVTYFLSTGAVLYNYLRKC